MTHSCENCHDTGSTSRDPDGYYNCTACTVAQERTDLEEWARGRQFSRLFIWEIYRRGKAAGLAETKCKI